MSEIAKHTYAERWIKINHLFLNHLPQTNTPTTISPEDTRVRIKPETENKFDKAIANLLNPASEESGNFAEVIAGWQLERSQIPFGYDEMLASTTFVSKVMDDLVADYPEFFTGFDFGYYGSYEQSYQEAMAMLDFFASFGDEYDEGESPITIKWGQRKVTLPTSLGRLIFSSVVKGFDKWLMDNNILINPNWLSNPFLAKRELKEYVKQTFPVDDLHLRGYVADWLDKHIPHMEEISKVDRAEFTFRFLAIFGYDEERFVDSLDLEIKHDGRGSSGYHSIRREMSEKIKTLINSYNNWKSKR